MSDLISRETYEQVRWERDTALEQLKDLGYSLGEKPRQSDLIRRQELKAQLDCVDRLRMITDEQVIEVIPRWNVNKIIENLPSAEPQIIRCKDCKHSYDDIGGTYCSYGVCVDCVVEEEFFCRDGERREEE